MNFKGSKNTTVTSKNPKNLTSKGKDSKNETENEVKLPNPEQEKK